MHQQGLEYLHLGHFGMQRMKQLARTAVYWPNIDEDIENMCRNCIPCCEYQNKPAKPAIHPWMLPEKPWSRFHLDHAINFLGNNWLVVTDAYPKYPCTHATQITNAKSTNDLLEQDFSHLGFPHTLATDVFMDWFTRSLSRFLQQESVSKFILLLDNLTDQMQNDFKEAVSGEKGLLWYGLPDATDLWQPVEAGYAA